jgi:hypothetical protein
VRWPKLLRITTTSIWRAPNRERRRDHARRRLPFAA